MSFSPASRITRSGSRLSICRTCRGEGKICKPPSRKARLRHKRMLKSSSSSTSISPLPRRWEPCSACQSTGLTTTTTTSTDDFTTNPTSTTNPSMSPSNNALHVAIVGGGIGGLALAVALTHRGISCTVYERDDSFLQRRQGYGLTMQQASKQLSAFGISNRYLLSSKTVGGVTSTRHVVHTIDGSVVGEWGMQKWKPNACADDSNNNDGNSTTNHNKSSSSNKRQNIHIARQALRQELLNVLKSQYCEEEERKDIVQWGCQLLNYKEMDDHVQLTFQKQHRIFTTKADLLVGADGIRSVVRSIYIGDRTTPLRYLDCIVILGICKRGDIPSDSALLDGKTVFQTADGSTRLYAMPYSPTEYMWQLSFPLEEEDAKQLSRRGTEALKQEALNRCGKWHNPIPQFLHATSEDLVSGYPVYDRELLTTDLLSSSRVTLLGDAAHPMSPFKGQGANQALLDSLSLARTLYRMDGDLEQALKVYTEEMLARSAVKVKASADAAQFLHSDIAIHKGNVTRAGAAAAVAATVTTEKTRGRHPTVGAQQES